MMNSVVMVMVMVMVWCGVVWSPHFSILHSDTAPQHLKEILLSYRYRTRHGLRSNNTDRLTVPCTGKAIEDRAFATCTCTCSAECPACLLLSNLPQTTRSFADHSRLAFCGIFLTFTTVTVNLTTANFTLPL